MTTILGYRSMSCLIHPRQSPMEGVSFGCIGHVLASTYDSVLMLIEAWLYKILLILNLELETVLEVFVVLMVWGSRSFIMFTVVSPLQSSATLLLSSHHCVIVLTLPLLAPDLVPHKNKYLSYFVNSGLSVSPQVPPWTTEYHYQLRVLAVFPT